MRDKTPKNNSAVEKLPAADLPTPLQDEFAGQGGSYLLDPVTNKRIKNLGDDSNG